MKSRAFKNRNVAVFGLGKSGFATAKRLHEGGAHVTVWDDNTDRRDQAKVVGVSIQDLTGAEWHGADILVLSPGVPLTHPAPHAVVGRANATNTPIVGDIEIFLQEKMAGKLVGITGTNGKSTTTALIHHILEVNNRDAVMGGNIGTPVLDLPQLGPDGVYVLELSSYQLDLTPSWKADIALILNITPDHLDRHGDMAHYTAVKERIFQKQVEGSVAILNIDDPVCAEVADRLEKIGAQSILHISTEDVVEGGVGVVDGLLQDRSKEGLHWTLDISDIEGLRGRHNWQNAAAAVAVVRALGLSDEEIENGLTSFKGLAHRMELIANDNGVRFVNDSKATNAEAAEKALASFDNIYWICGGIPKAGGIDALSRYFPKIKHAYLIGEAEDTFAKALDGRVEFTKCHDLTVATNMARQDAQTLGEDATVLLSPAAASFDQFPSFEARGDAFKALIREGVE